MTSYRMTRGEKWATTLVLILSAAFVIFGFVYGQHLEKQRLQDEKSGITCTDPEVDCP